MAALVCFCCGRFKAEHICTFLADVSAVRNVFVPSYLLVVWHVLGLGS